MGPEIVSFHLLPECVLIGLESKLRLLIGFERKVSDLVIGWIAVETLHGGALEIEGGGSSGSRISLGLGGGSDE